MVRTRAGTRTTTSTSVASNATDSCDPALRMVLRGTICASSPLRLLRGKEDILKSLFGLVLEEYWAACLEDTAARHPRAWAREFERCTSIKPADPDDDENAPRTGFGYPRWPGWLSLSIFGRETEDGEFIRTRSDRLVTFPENRGRYCNMLPFRFDDLTTLPTEFHGYIDLIQRCQSHSTDYARRDPCVAYLTVDERAPAPGASQRRPGLHCERAGATGSHMEPPEAFGWGYGTVCFKDCAQPTGGIFMASTVGGTTRIWNTRVCDAAGDGVIGPHGNLERLRPLLDGRVESHTLEANELAWMTDRTPHESLPVPDGAPRQYFRLVVGTVDLWYAAHSTANPRVPLPDTVRVVTGDKFASAPPLRWVQGDAALAEERTTFRTMLESYSLGDRVDDIAALGVRTVADLRGVATPVALGINAYMDDEDGRVVRGVQIGYLDFDDPGGEFGPLEKGGGNLYTLWASVRVQPSVRAVLELWEQSASIWPAHLDEDAMGEDREFEG